MITRSVAADISLDMVSTFGPWGFFPQLTAPVPVTSAWEAANRTIYTPMFIPVVCTVKRFWWANGTPVNASASYAMAMYRDAGYKPGVMIGSASAATAQGTASTVQFVSPASGDFVLSPGLWWIALGSNSNTTTQIFSSNAGFAGANDATYRYQQAVAVPPSTATPVESGGANPPLCGFSTTTLT